jgi:chloramphenicol O-acetyltransferase type A
VHPVAHASTTVLRRDESIGFARLRWHPEFAAFVPPARAAIVAARDPQAFLPLDDEDSLLHFTTLPWVHFTSFSHARSGRPDDDTPKFAFGRIDTDGDRQWMPLAVEVHHALMDGLQVGRFIEGFEAALARPEQAWGRPAV